MKVKFYNEMQRLFLAAAVFFGIIQAAGKICT